MSNEERYANIAAYRTCQDELEVPALDTHAHNKLALHVYDLVCHNRWARLGVRMRIARGCRVKRRWVEEWCGCACRCGADRVSHVLASPHCGKCEFC